MASNIENNKRLALNTIALYVRTAIVLLLSLFITRLLLKQLGIEDFGLYNLVGSVVVLFSFLSSGLILSIQRFLSYEIGRGREDKLNKVFSISFFTQIIIVFLLIILCETIGLYFLNNKLNISEDRVYAANYLFQISIAIFSINIIRGAYEALVIAYERMKIYAYASIADAVAKLLIVVLLCVDNGDKLILYANLLLCETILYYIIYYIYCRSVFQCCRIIFVWDKQYFKNIISFTGWNAFGSLSNVLTQNGFIFVINIFFGVVANAALGIANQVSSALTSFISSFQTSFRPQIVKAYAQDDEHYLTRLVTETSKLSYVLIFLPFLFVFTNIDFILSLWLTVVPQGTSDFCRLILIISLFDAITGSYNCAILATGKIKAYQIIISLSFIADLTISYLIAFYGCPLKFLLLPRLFMRGFVNCGVGLHFMSKQIGFDIKTYFFKVLLKVLLFTFVFLLGSTFLSNIFSNLILLIYSSVAILLLVCPTLYLLILDKNERAYIINVTKKILHG